MKSDLNPELNPDLTPGGRAELEARVTALLLGELSAEDAAALRQIMSQDAALAKLHDRLRRTLDLVRETAASSAGGISEQTAPFRLSPARREALLAHFKTIAPAELAKPRARRVSLVLQLAAAAALMLLLAAVFLPALTKSKARSASAMLQTQSATVLRTGRLKDAPLAGDQGDQFGTIVVTRPSTASTPPTANKPALVLMPPTHKLDGSGALASSTQSTKPPAVDEASKANLAAIGPIPHIPGVVTPPVAASPARPPRTAIYTGKPEESADGNSADKGLVMKLDGVTVDQALAFLSESEGLSINRKTSTAGAGIVDLESDKPLNKDETIAAVNKTLADHNLAAVRDGNVLNIMSMDDAAANASTPAGVVTTWAEVPQDSHPAYATQGAVGPATYTVNASGYVTFITAPENSTNVLASLAAGADNSISHSMTLDETGGGNSPGNVGFRTETKGAVGGGFGGGGASGSSGSSRPFALNNGVIGGQAGTAPSYTGSASVANPSGIFPGPGPIASEAAKMDGITMTDQLNAIKKRMQEGSQQNTVQASTTIGNGSTFSGVLHGVSPISGYIVGSADNKVLEDGGPIAATGNINGMGYIAAGNPSAAGGRGGGGGGRGRRGGGYGATNGSLGFDTISGYVDTSTLWNPGTGSPAAQEARVQGQASAAKDAERLAAEDFTSVAMDDFQSSSDAFVSAGNVGVGGVSAATNGRFAPGTIGGNFYAFDGSAYAQDVGKEAQYQNDARNRERDSKSELEQVEPTWLLSSDEGKIRQGVEDSMEAARQRGPTTMSRVGGIAAATKPANHNLDGSVDFTFGTEVAQGQNNSGYDTFAESSPQASALAGRPTTNRLLSDMHDFGPGYDSPGQLAYHGVSVGGVAFPAPITAVSPLPRSNNVGGNFNGVISSVSMFSNSLTDSQLKSLFPTEGNQAVNYYTDGPASVTKPAPSFAGVVTNAAFGAVAYWPLNETADPSVGGVAAFDAVGGFNGFYGTNAANGLVAGAVRPSNGDVASGNAEARVAATSRAWMRRSNGDVASGNDEAYDIWGGWNGTYGTNAANGWSTVARVVSPSNGGVYLPGSAVAGNMLQTPLETPARLTAAKLPAAPASPLDRHLNPLATNAPPRAMLAIVEDLSKPQAPAQAKAAIQVADKAPLKPAVPPPVPQPEIQTRDNAFSTFSLNVSDVSFKLAAASLQSGQMPDAASVRSEEFINAFNYRDSEPATGAPVGFASQRAGYPFAHNRDLLRFAVKTAAEGRQAGRPLNLVLLLDKSGSMERADRVAIIREALRVLAGQLKAQDTISVVVFSRTARLFADGVSGSQFGALAAELEAITPEGGTNLEEAMKLAYEAALRHYLANGENRVVVLTDGAANLGDVEPEGLKKRVESDRAQGIALDCFGVGWEDYNDTLLETLSRSGGGRYGFVNTPEEAATEFAGQLAGALRVAASDVKVQVEFNPDRVISWRQIGYAKDQMTKEQFRDNTVKAAQIAVAESGNALYTVELNPAGEGPICVVHVRYRAPGTADYYEHAWAVPYNGPAATLDKASPPMRLAATASAFSEWLARSPYAGEVTLNQLQGYLRGVPEYYGADTRPKLLETMLREAGSISGR